MHDQRTIEHVGELRGSSVYDSAGEKIGKVDEIYYDVETRRPEWVSLGTGLFKNKHVLAPLAGAEERGGDLYLRYSKEQVKGSPAIDSEEIEPGYESSLYSYYGIDHSTRRSDSVLPDEAPGAPMAGRGPAAEERGSVTRKEEELRVGTRPVETGRVRLRKWVEDEPVEADVELTRERAHVERQRIEEPVSGHEFREEEVEVPLAAEEPVVEKRAVAKERVSVGKHAESERQTVADTVQKERVDVDGEGVENVDDVD